VHRGNVLADAAVPYFFLSYAHAPQIDAGDSPDPDIWVEQLFSDLCVEVKQLADLPRNANTGYLDRETRPGDEWPRALARALATCRVFVPLYSPRYFADERCGKEWSYFAGRAQNQTEGIVPGAWQPVDNHSLPSVAQKVRLGHGGNRAYESHGFYGIMKVSRYRADYQEAVFDLAHRIVTAAQRCRLPEGPRPDYRRLHSAFGLDSKGAPWNRVLRITVVAPGCGELPRSRKDVSCYGRSPQAWNPFAAGPIADEANRLAREHRDQFRAEVGDLWRHKADLLSGKPGPGPQLLLIDPWALLLPQYQEVIQRFNAQESPWVQTLIVLSDSDAESQDKADKLRATLDAVLGRKPAAAGSKGAHEVGSLTDFRAALPRLIDAAAQGYRRRTPTFPPAGSALERPRLGFVPNYG
jgi:FxsC-like protein